MAEGEAIGRRPRRAAAKNSAVGGGNQPSALHYVGYVEEDETPEQIMAKFEQLEKIQREAEQAKAATQLQAAELRRRMNDELNFPPNFERLVLGCIDADFCK